MFTDIVESTATLERIGDKAWQRMLRPQRPVPRATLTSTAAGRSRRRGTASWRSSTAPPAPSAVPGRWSDPPRGMDLPIRVGIHTGEVEFIGDDARGLAVHTASRVMALGDADDVMVSSTTRDLLEGSEVRLVDAGEHELKGLPGVRRVFRLETDCRHGLPARLRDEGRRWRARRGRADRAGRRPSRRSGRACTRAASSSRVGRRPASPGCARPGVADVGGLPDRPVRGANATEPLPAPGQVAAQPRAERHEREQQRQHDRDDEDELLQLRAEVGQRLAGSTERVAGDVADLRADERQAGQGFAQVAAALDQPVTARPDVRPASAKPDRNWNSCQTMLPQNRTQASVATSASCSLVRAMGSSLQILIMVRPPDSDDASSALGRWAASGDGCGSDGASAGRSPSDTRPPR